MKKVSVIVPIFNVEEQLDDCLSSLVKQTLKDIEILCINDGSPDRSAEIVEKYAEKYPDCIVPLKKPNGGLSSARNFGLVRASGEYVAFVDGDDTVAPTFCEELYAAAKSGNADISVCDIEYCYKDPAKNFSVSSGIECALATKEDVKKKFVFFYPAACNKLFHRELLQKTGLLFKEGIWYEDVEFFHRLLPHIGSVATVRAPLYHYLQREGSITHVQSRRLFDYISNFKGILAYYRESGFIDDYHDELEYSTVRYLYATFLKRCASLDKNTFHEAKLSAKQFIETNYPCWKKNPYFRSTGLKGRYLLICDRIPEFLLRRCIR